LKRADLEEALVFGMVKDGTPHDVAVRKATLIVDIQIHSGQATLVGSELVLTETGTTAVLEHRKSSQANLN